MGVGKRRLVLLSVVVLAVVMVSLPTVDAATGTEWIDVDSFDATYEEWTQITGASPYLNAQDHPTHFIRESKDELVDHGWFGFPDTTLTGTLTVNVSIWGFADDTDDGVHIFVDKSGSGGGSDEGILIVDQNTGSYKTLSLGAMSVAEVNALRIFLRTTDTTMDDIEIDHMRLGVSGTAGGNDYTAYPDGDFSLTGETSLIAGFVKALVEGFTLIGTTGIFVIIQKIIAEGFGLTGGTSLAVSYSVLLAAGFVLAGAASLASNYSVRLSVGFSLGGTVTLAASYVKNLVEGFSLADTVSAFKVFIVELIDDFTVGVESNIEKIAGTVLIGSMFYQLFFSLNMWGYLGPIALVVIGYLLTKKEKNLGIFVIIVESLVIAQYLALIEATPDYWWNVIILLLGVLLTIGQWTSDR